MKLVTMTRVMKHVKMMMMLLLLNEVSLQIERSVASPPLCDNVVIMM